MAERVAGGFAAVYPVLAALEERGAARRGYFVEGLGAAQFAVPGAVDRLRALAEPPTAPGARRGGRWCSPRPTRPTRTARRCPGRSGWSTPATASRRRRPGTGPGRKAGALVVLVGGDLVLYVERGGRTLLSFTDDTDALAAAGKALADAVHSGALGRDVGGAGRRRGGALLAAARRAHRRRLPGHPARPAPARLTARAAADARAVRHVDDRDACESSR